MSSTICTVELEAATVQPIQCSAVAKLTWRVVLPILAIVVGIAGIQGWESWRGVSPGITAGKYGLDVVLSVVLALVFVGMGVTFYLLERREFQRIEALNQDAAILFEARAKRHPALFWAMVMLALDLLLLIPLLWGGVQLSNVGLFLPTACCSLECACLALSVQRRRIIVSERGILSDRLISTKFYPWTSIQEADWREGTRTLVCRIVPEAGKTAQLETIDLKFLTAGECQRWLEIVRPHLPDETV